MADSLVLEIWQQYLARIKVNDRLPRLEGANKIYLSAVTGCARKECLRILGYPRAPYSAESNVNMNSGIKGEEKVAVVLEASGHDIIRQQPVITKYGNGKVDIYMPGDGHIIEVKTSTFDRMKWLPNREHIDQCLLYMGFLEVHSGEVVYLLKEAHATVDGNEKIVAYVVEWDQRRFDELVRRLEEIDTYTRAGKVIDVSKEYARDKMPCEYPKTGKCIYWMNCYGPTETKVRTEVDMKKLPEIHEQMRRVENLRVDMSVRADDVEF